MFQTVPMTFHGPKSAAHRIGISRVTLWRWRQAGRLPEPTLIDGRDFWTAEQLDKLKKDETK